MTNRAPRVAEGFGALRLDAFASTVDIGDTGGTLRVFSLIFLTRSGCHLCESAEPLVRRLAAQSGAHLEVRDIDADPVLLAEFSARIPVVLGPSGRVLAEGIIEEGDLETALSAETGRSF